MRRANKSWADFPTRYDTCGGSDNVSEIVTPRILISYTRLNAPTMTMDSCSRRKRGLRKTMCCDLVMFNARLLAEAHCGNALQLKIDSVSIVWWNN